MIKYQQVSTLALSLTDSYWICPDNTNFLFDNVSLFNIAVFSNKKIPFHKIESYDPNASLGGQMEKYWDVSGMVPVLVKESYKYFGQQAVNEVFATKLHEFQKTDIPYVKYTAAKTEDNGIICRCNSFITRNIEFISAYEVVESSKKKNDMSMYDYYIDICVKNGIDRELIQNFMDYQTLMDFVISNTDEHLNNFGVLRDANTLKLVAPAPIFDSGNSMFFVDNMKTPYSRADILKQKITGFYSTEEKILKCVKNKNIVKEDLLPDKDFVMNVYTAAGIPEWKADVISDNYMIKKQMLRDFQQGYKISMYHEKQTVKQDKKTDNSLSFIMMCGIAGSGKSKKAKEICDEWNKNGLNFVHPNELYSIRQAVNDTSIIMDKEKVLKGLPVIKKEKSYTLISANQIRKELKDYKSDYDDELVFFIVEIRIRLALRNNISVVYDALNLEKKDRMYYINIAEELGIYNKKLYLMNAAPSDIISDIPLERLVTMNYVLQANIPYKEEGWTEIQYCNNFFNSQ